MVRAYGLGRLEDPLLEAVTLPAADRASRRGDERADGFRRCFAGGVRSLLGFLFRYLHLGNNVVNALLGILLRQAGASRD